MSRRSHFSGFGSAVSNHKLWLRAKEIESLRKAKEQADKTNKNAPATLTAKANTSTGGN